MGVRRETLESLNFAQVVHLKVTASLNYLVDGVEVVFHAFNCNVLSSLNALRLEHLREGTFAFFANKTVL